jgi:hypothetical protein
MSEPIKICIQRAETRQEWDSMQDDYINRAIAAAARIEELEKYQSIHAQCDKVSLELEAKLVKQLSAAHNRIKKLEAALREITSVSKVMAKSENMAQALTTLLSSHRKIALAALEEKND